MAKYITEDDIEIAVLDRLSHPDFGYDIINAMPTQASVRTSMTARDAPRKRSVFCPAF